MLKFRTIGMFEKSAANVPHLKADVDMKNGALHVVDFENSKIVLPSDDFSYAALAVAMNEGSGDEKYTDFMIKKGEFVNSYLLKNFLLQELVFDESHITYGDGEKYSSIVAGETMLGVGNDGNFKIISDKTGRDIFFAVTEKLQFNGNAVVALISVD